MVHPNLCRFLRVSALSWSMRNKTPPETMNTEPRTILSESAILLCDRRANHSSTSSLKKPPADQQLSKLLTSPPISRTLLLRNRRGLHFRPAALLAETLKSFACSTSVENGSAVADGRSIFGLMSLAAGAGSRLTFTACGKEAKEALEEVQRLFETDFALAY